MRFLIKRLFNSSKDNQDQRNPILDFELELARIKYDSELRREDSIIEQSGRMQSAFSFMLAAIAIVAAILSNHSGAIPLGVSIASVSSVMCCLMVSLILATVSQSRKTQKLWADINQQREYIESNENIFEDVDVRTKHLLDMYEEHQKSLTENNRKRVELVVWSMRTFYVSIGLCLLWFVIILYLL